MAHVVAAQLAIGLAALLAGPGDLGPQPALPGDVNVDGLVDYDDVVEHLWQWGPCDWPRCRADLDDDGFVDLFDLLWLLAELDRTPLIVAVPGDRSA